MNDGSRKIVAFTDLNAWKKGHDLVLLVYQETRTFPSHELYGLTNQMRRAALSITSNVAEGFSRRSYREKRQFYFTALGSLTELQSHLLVSKDLGYIQETTFTQLQQQSVVVHKLLNGLIKHTKTIIHDSSS